MLLVGYVVAVAFFTTKNLVEGLSSFRAPRPAKTREPGVE